MRLWHKDLIPVLPKKQLLAQWRECCCIARNIAVNGTPNHILVNRILDYPIDHFIYYSEMIATEMFKRKYTVKWEAFEKHNLRTDDGRIKCDFDKLFEDWHNRRYLRQCFYNLQEKYDCGGISDEEWRKIINFVEAII